MMLKLKAALMNIFALKDVKVVTHNDKPTPDFVVPISSMERFSVFKLIILVFKHTTLLTLYKSHCTLSAQHHTVV